MWLKDESSYPNQKATSKTDNAVDVGQALHLRNGKTLYYYSLPKNQSSLKELDIFDSPTDK